MKSNIKKHHLENERLIKKLKNPYLIQTYLDSLKYNTDEIVRSPLEVVRCGKAHCFDGAMFGAAALEQIGFPPLIVYMHSSLDDDDHVIAVFRGTNGWGAVAKSNYTGCRFRDPIYRNLRELMMSYFDVYFNLAGKKTLRAYSLPINLSKISDIDWRTTKESLKPLEYRFNKVRRFKLLSAAQLKELSPVDSRSFKAATLGLDPRGAFKVKNSKL